MNNIDYKTALQGLRLQAKAHGLDPNTADMSRFLNHEAEVLAQLYAEVRGLGKVLHA